MRDCSKQTGINIGKNESKVSKELVWDPMEVGF